MRETPHKLQETKTQLKSLIPIVIMKFTSAAISLVVFVTGTVALPNGAPISLRNAEPGSLEARSCDYTTGCRSLASSNSLWTGSGKYCGFCLQVEGDWIPTHIYQYDHFSIKTLNDLSFLLHSSSDTDCLLRVNGGSGASSCCDYGYSSKCAAKYAALGNKYAKLPTCLDVSQ
jgi:hypothetical protein